MRLTQTVSRPLVFEHLTYGTYNFTLPKECECNIRMIGAGGHSFALYSGDYAYGGSGWRGKSAMTGGVGARMTVKAVLPAGSYKVEVGALGGGTNLTEASYSGVKEPGATQGSRTIHTTLYNSKGAILLRAGGGNSATYSYAGNQKNDGACYTGSAGTGGVCTVNIATLSQTLTNGADGVKNMSGGDTSAYVNETEPYGFPNDVTACWYVEAYSIGYTVSGGSSGYFKLETTTKIDYEIRVPYVLHGSNNKLYVMRSYEKKCYT